MKLDPALEILSTKLLFINFIDKIEARTYP